MNKLNAFLILILIGIMSLTVYYMGEDGRKKEKEEKKYQAFIKKEEEKKKARLIAAEGTPEYIDFLQKKKEITQRIKSAFNQCMQWSETSRRGTKEYVLSINKLEEAMKNEGLTPKNQNHYSGLVDGRLLEVKVKATPSSSGWTHECIVEYEY